MDDEESISKTRRKRQMHDLQAVGAALVALAPEKLARVELPEALREAVTEARGMTKHEARRRQMQYIGRLMREVDAAPIVEQLNAFDAPSKKQTALFHLAERWRQTLIDDPSGLERFLQEFPAADAAELRSLTEAARADARGARGPKAFRALFHAVNAAVQAHARKPS